MFILQDIVLYVNWLNTIATTNKLARHSASAIINKRAHSLSLASKILSKHVAEIQHLQKCQDFSVLIFNLMLGYWKLKTKCLQLCVFCSQAKYDARNDDKQKTILPFAGKSWQTQSNGSVPYSQLPSYKIKQDMNHSLNNNSKDVTHFV